MEQIVAVPMENSRVTMTGLQEKQHCSCIQDGCPKSGAARTLKHPDKEQQNLGKYEKGNTR